PNNRRQSAGHERMPQPGAPHLTNYPAAQSVNAAQPFVLGWDAFPGELPRIISTLTLAPTALPTPGCPAPCRAQCGRSPFPPAPSSRTPITFRASVSSVTSAQPTEVTPPLLI